MKLFSTSFCTSEILPEVEQISLFASMENGKRLCPTELLPIELSTLNIGESPTVAEEYMLSAILVEKPPRWSLLSVAALNGILDRASRRGGQTVACLAPDCYSWHDRMVEAGKLRGGGAERAYTLKIRQGCEGGGKGPLVQTELSATLATRQDQSLIQRAAGFDLGNSGGIGYSEECSPTLMTGAGGNKTAVVQNQRLMESLVLNDQGGKNMDVSVNVTGTLRAQTHGHPPVVFQKSEDEGNET